MTTQEELAAVDAEWDTLLSEADAEADTERHPRAGARTGEHDEGTFGHASERRLGLRAPAVCWALLRDGERGVYARTVELSATSAVLRFLDAHDLRFDDAHPFTLDLFVPTSSRPIHATARPARAVGAMEAFELSDMNAADRLTLAEHLDSLAAKRSRKSPATSAVASTATPGWSRFVQSLKSAEKRAPEAQRL